MSQHEKISCSKPFTRPTIDDFIHANNKMQNNIQLQCNSDKTEDINKRTLKKELSLCDMVFFGLCLTIGTGAYVLTGIVGKNYSGSGIIFTNIISSLTVGISALAYIEFSSRIHVIGGGYTYVLASSGELLGFMSGFASIMVDPISGSVSAIGCINYLKSFLEVIGIKYFENNNFWTGYQPFSNSNLISINIFAPIVSIILCIICLFGVKLSSRMMNIASVSNLLMILLFIICGIFYVDPNNWFHPCDNHKYDSHGTCSSNEDNSFLPFGFSGAVSGCGILLWSYVGLEQIPTIAEECKNPTKIIPKTMLIVWIIITIIYTVLSFILVGMIPFQSLDTNTPLATAFKLHNNYTFQCIVSFGAFSFCCLLVVFVSVCPPSSFIAAVYLYAGCGSDLSVTSVSILCDLF
eukprot:149876_1